MVSYLIPLIASIIAMVLGFIWAEPMEQIIRGEGLRGPEAFVILAPTLQFIGALSLLFSMGKLTPQDDIEITEAASKMTNELFGKNRLVFEAAWIQKTHTKGLLSISFQNRLETVERYLSLGILCSGFLIQLIVEFVKQDISVRCFPWMMLLITVVLIILRCFAWPRWRSKAKDHAVEDTKKYLSSS